MTTPGAVTMPALVTIPNVDLVAAGTWNLSTGEATFTTQDLADAVDAAQCPAVGAPVIKLGHVDRRFDGEPSIGRVTNLALAASGTKVTGDLAGMPGWLAAIASSAYPQRSVEGAWGFTCQIGHTHPFVITALALLGVSPPGVGVLGGLEHVASLYGVAAAAGQAAATWTTTAGGAMPDPAQAAAAITVDDVRKAYYQAAPMSYWITEIQMAPTQLIVCDDAEGKVYRVPFTIKGETITFSDPVAVDVVYEDVAAMAAVRSGTLLAFASAEDSRRGMEVQAAWSASAQIANMGDSPSASAIKAMFALPAATKTDSKLPHHDVSASTHAVGAANPDGCSAGIGAINGAHGGLKGVSAADAKKAYNHMAAHLRKAGQEPPEYSGPAASAQDGAAAAAADHPYTGEHSHPHAAMGAQGGDQEHDHPHTHAGDGNHAHAHAGAGPTKKGAADVELSDAQKAQIRAALGLGDDEEVTAEHVMAMAAKVTEAATAPPPAPSGDPEPAEPVAAAAHTALPPGVISVDKEVWEQTQQRIRQGEAARAEQLHAKMETSITAAVQAGKFPVSRADHWRRLYNRDPEGTEQVLAGLTPGVVPTQDIGAPGGPQAAADEQDYAHLFPPEYTRTAVFNRD